MPMAPATAAGGSSGASASAAFQWSRSAISNACEWWASSAERLNLTPVKVRLTASELVVPALAGSGVGAGVGPGVVGAAVVVVGAAVVLVGAAVVVPVHVGP